MFKKMSAMLLVLVLLFLGTTTVYAVNGISVETYIGKYRLFPNNSPDIDALRMNSTIVGQRAKTYYKSSHLEFYLFSFPNSDIVEFAIVRQLGNTSTLDGTNSVALMTPVYSGTSLETYPDRHEKARQEMIACVYTVLTTPYTLGSTVGEYQMNAWRNDGTPLEMNYMWLNKESTLDFEELSDLCGFLVVTADAWEMVTSDSPKTIDDANSYTLLMGEYVVGTHIPAGEYIVYPDDFGTIFVYSDDGLKVSELLDAEDNDVIGRLVLKDGDIINISGTSMTFVKR